MGIACLRVLLEGWTPGECSVDEHFTFVLTSLCTIKVTVFRLLRNERRVYISVCSFVKDESGQLSCWAEFTIESGGKLERSRPVCAHACNISTSSYFRKKRTR